jgi:hypothetical protein
MTDVLSRVRAADPVASEPDAPPVEWMLARLDAAGDSPAPLAPARGRAPAAPRPRRRRPVVAGLAAATGLAAAGVLAGSWSSPDVVAQAREALVSDGAVIHTLTVDQPLDADGRPSPRRRFVFSRKPRRIGYGNIQFERWSAQDPRRERSVSTIFAADGGANAVSQTAYAHGVYRWEAPYLEGGVKTFRVPKRLRGRQMPPPNVTMPGPDPVAGIRTLLADKQLEPAGEVVLDGRRLLSLRGTLPSKTLKNGFVTPEIRVEYLVDPESYEPVRIDQRSFDHRGGKLVSSGGHRVTFKTYERLPLTAANLALLKLQH